jgi:hypothetical protein
LPDAAIVSSAAAAMNVVIYVFSGLYIALTVALLFAYWRIRQPGLVLISTTYGSSAALALLLMEWWPLLAGFALAWVLRLMGMDPVPRPPEDKRAE